MNTKKEIRKFIVEHSAELSKYYTCERKIYLTDKDYVQVEIWENLSKRIIIRLHLDSRQYSIFCAEGRINDLDGVWRKFRYRFKRKIAEEEEFGRDAKFLAKLKEIYSLL